MSVRVVTGDVFAVDLPLKHYALVYADPPYAGCRAVYARRNNSRQWGLNPRADFMRELIARMDSLRRPDGVCALSMGSGELKLMHLFPSSVRVCAWVKPTASPRPGIWPTYAWEPLVIWGKLPGKASPGTNAPNDWAEFSSARPKNAKHETPKPPAFGTWVLWTALGPRQGPVCELFAGGGPVAQAADEWAMEATAVDLVDSISEKGAA